MCSKKIDKTISIKYDSVEELFSRLDIILKQLEENLLKGNTGYSYKEYNVEVGDTNCTLNIIIELKDGNNS